MYMGASQSQGHRQATEAQSTAAVPAPSHVTVRVCYGEAPGDSLRREALVSLHGALCACMPSHVTLKRVEADELAMIGGQPAFLCILCRSAARLDRDTAAWARDTIDQAIAKAAEMGGAGTQPLMAVWRSWTPSAQLAMAVWREAESNGHLAGPVFFKSDGQVQPGVGLSEIQRLAKERVAEIAPRPVTPPVTARRRNKSSARYGNQSNDQHEWHVPRASAWQKEDESDTAATPDLRQTLRRIGRREKLLLEEQQRLLTSLQKVAKQLELLAGERTAALGSPDQADGRSDQLHRSIHS